MPALSAVLMCRVTLFHTIGFNTQYRTSDVAENLDNFLCGAYIPGERLCIDSQLKMEIRHPIDGQFGRKFPAICKHYGVMTA